jgi:hypothetical protein
MMRGIYIVLLSTAFLLEGCAYVKYSTGHKTPGGAVQYIINCGAFTGWNFCYEKANELCPNGYSDVSKYIIIPLFNTKRLTIECQN